MIIRKEGTYSDGTPKLVVYPENKAQTDWLKKEFGGEPITLKAKLAGDEASGLTLLLRRADTGKK